MKHLPLILSALAGSLLTVAPTIAQPTRLPEAWVMTGTTDDGSLVYLDRNSVKHRVNNITFALKTVFLNRGGFSFNRISANCNTRRWRTTSLKVVDGYGNTLKPNPLLPSGIARSGDSISEALRSACGY